MEEIVAAIENGKQRGSSRSLERDGTTYWCDAAIQKHDGQYKAHVSVIREENMTCEEFEIFFTRGFSDLQGAIDCVNSNGEIRFDEFAVLRGQRIFNPVFAEENEDASPQD